ncbi:hypothetical protein GGI35DRAFT_86617 [Trichoderma velutinum]
MEIRLRGGSCQERLYSGATSCLALPPWFLRDQRMSRLHKKPLAKQTSGHITNQVYAAHAAMLEIGCIAATLACSNFAHLTPLEVLFLGLLALFPSLSSGHCREQPMPLLPTPAFRPIVRRATHQMIVRWVKKPSILLHFEFRVAF